MIQLWTQMATLAVPLLFLSDQFKIAAGRAGSVLPPCLSVQISVSMFWFSWYLYCCSCTSRLEYHVCTVHDIIMGEHGCAIVHGLRPWPWPGTFSGVLNIGPGQFDPRHPLHHTIYALLHTTLPTFAGSRFSLQVTTGGNTFNPSPLVFMVKQNYFAFGYLLIGQSVHILGTTVHVWERFKLIANLVKITVHEHRHQRSMTACTIVIDLLQV